MGERIVIDLRKPDVGSILAFGFGFAPFTGGVRSYIDLIRVPAFVALARSLEAKHGPRFAVPDSLAIMAESGKSFYSDGKRAA